MISGKFVLCYGKFCYVRKIFFDPSNGTLTKNFLATGGGGGGGRSSEKIISGKKFFAVRPPHFLGWIDALAFKCFYSSIFPSFPDFKQLLI